MHPVAVACKNLCPLISSALTLLFGWEDILHIKNWLQYPLLSTGQLANLDSPGKCR